MPIAYLTHMMISLALDIPNTRDCRPLHRDDVDMSAVESSACDR